MRTAAARVVTTTLMLVTAVFGLVAPTASVRATPPDDEVSWGVRPAVNDGSAVENFVYSIEPGDSITNSIVVTNYDSEPLQLNLYAADGFTTANGQLDVLTPDIPSTMIGAWVTFDAQTVTIPAADGENGQSAEVPFTLTVPAATTPGDYAGAIITSLLTTDERDRFSVDRRLGVRIYLRVEGDLNPELSVEEFSIDYHAALNPFGLGSTTATLSVTNVGNTRLSASANVALAGAFGSDASANMTIPELLPGESWTAEATVGGVLPVGGLDATATITPALPDGTPLAPFTATATTRGIWWPLVVMTAVLVALIVAVVMRIRRQRRDSPETTPVADKVTGPDAEPATDVPDDDVHPDPDPEPAPGPDFDPRD